MCLIPFKIFGGSGVRLTGVRYYPAQYFNFIIINML